jgi:tight adherence protein B
VTAIAWSLLAVALMLAAPTSRVRARVAVLASRGRLAGATAPVSLRARGETQLQRPLSPRRQLLRRRRSLRDAIRLLVSELEAGSSTERALLAAVDAADARSGAVFLAAAGAVSNGGSAGDIFSQAEPMLRPLGAAWGVADRAGIAPAEALARIAADLDAELDKDAAVSVMLAGPRSSALLLAGLPLLGLLLGAAMGARPLPFLVGSSVGHVVGVIGIGLDAAGVLWTQRLIALALR